MPRLTKVLLLACLALLGAQGCGPNNVRLINDLKEVGITYISMHDVNQKGPANWDEMTKFSPEAAPAIGRVKAAGYTMTWDVKFSSVTGGTSNTVLAKPPGAGPTLMMDGSVR